MKKAVKEAWLSALRSGEYKQHCGSLCNTFGSDRLMTANKFCCIGVIGSLKKLNVCATHDVTDAVGLNIFQTDRLIAMNDIDKKSFPEIADWIEANIPTED